MERDARGHGVAQHAYEVGHEGGGVLLGGEEVAVVLLGELHELGHGLGVVAEYEGRDIKAHEALERGQARLVAQGLEICALNAANELQALRVKVVVKPGELQRRAVDVGGCYPRGVEILRGMQDGEVLLLEVILLFLNIE